MNMIKSQFLLFGCILNVALKFNILAFNLRPLITKYEGRSHQYVGVSTEIGFLYQEDSAKDTGKISNFRNGITESLSDNGAFACVSQLSSNDSYEIDSVAHLYPTTTDLVMRIPSDTFTQKKSFAKSLAEKELWLMQRIQALDIPYFPEFSILVHYSLLPQVMAPIFALLAWMVSLPMAGSLICFLNAQDIINTAIKWSVQRPRPMWYTKGLIRSPKNSSSSVASWEADYSFPSAHTQFFAGLAFCACEMGTKGPARLGMMSALAFGALIGVTRSFLGVHWPSDTSLGLLLGAVLGTLWGRYDPYAWLLHQASPLLSLSVATTFTGALTCLLHLARRVTPEAENHKLAEWGDNLISHYSVNPESSKLKFLPKQRQLRSKVAMLSTVFFTLAYTAFYSKHLPTAMMEPMKDNFVQAIIGLGGMSGVVTLLKRRFTVMPKLIQRSVGAKTALKAAAYAGICAWVLLLTQLASHRLVYLLGF